MNNKEIQFSKLCEDVRACKNCSRMKNSSRVLNGSCGSLDADIMFIGEAPGRLGADGSEIPFHGDKSGDNFEKLLRQVGISRYQIFVTNAALCNPKDDKGNNATPNRQELTNCSPFLKEQIELVNPKFVVSLGASSLKALSMIEDHDFSLKKSVRTCNKWFGRKLIPLYHPGQRAMIHRSYANQLSDYQFIAENLKRADSKPRKIQIKMKEDVNVVVDFITFLKPKLTYFALHKLFYIIEYEFFKRYGNKLTESYFIRQKDGPYCTDLHYKKIIKSIDNIRVSNVDNNFFIERRPLNLFDRDDSLKYRALSTESRDIIMRAIEIYGDLDNTELKRKVYLTSPMRKILKAERAGVNLYNSPIAFG